MNNLWADRTLHQRIGAWVRFIMLPFSTYGAPCCVRQGRLEERMNVKSSIVHENTSSFSLLSNFVLSKQINKYGAKKKNTMDASPLNTVSRCSPSSCALAHQTSSCPDRNGSCHTPSCSTPSSVCTSPVCVSGRWWSIVWCASWRETCGLWGPGGDDKGLGEAELGAGTKMAGKATWAQKAMLVESKHIFVRACKLAKSKPDRKVKFYILKCQKRQKKFAHLFPRQMRRKVTIKSKINKKRVPVHILQDLLRRFSTRPFSSKIEKGLVQKWPCVWELFFVHFKVSNSKIQTMSTVWNH